MENTNLYHSLSLILPEIVISVALIVLVLADLIFHKDKKYIPYIALVSILVAGYYTLIQYGTSGSAFLTSGKNTISLGMFAADSFSIFFKMIVLVSTLFIVFFSFSSEEIIKIKDRIGEYYALIFGMVLGMFFMISATDLILIYLSMELMSLSSYVLSGFTKLRERNSEAALKYLLYGAVSSGLMLFGISLVYGLTGSTNLYAINALIQSPEINLFTLAFACILIFAGIGYKISSAPFHFWTPDVYEGAPITITAFLSVASKAAGFALLIRFIKTTFVSYIDPLGMWHLLNVFDWRSMLVAISILTMTLGNFSALWQNNMKRMLAYSSIAHAGYLLLGLVVLSNQGILAILIYFSVYLVMNLGAFLVVMLIANKTGSEDIDDYDGLGHTSPFLGISLAIFLVSLTGLPPTAGFIGKLYLFVALVDAQMIVVAVIALLNSVVSLYYYVRVLKHMFLTKSVDETPVVSVSIPNIILVSSLVFVILLFGVYFTPLVDAAQSCLVILGL
ncbi:MAG: NADH-quinone oxidoreductase subunit N [Ignavibacteriae bacterium HGW-Ignavibacteriae-3]|nr:MAG: NADH-quinone oxidoreductase subunit N [Ignavibacteriae bacterium HGW-Ignavibacteriae-3]